jgi:hypothetical protein
MFASLLKVAGHTRSDRRRFRSGTFLLSVVRFFARRAKKRTTGENKQHHAAMHPELACPELVEGSKGRQSGV